MNQTKRCVNCLCSFYPAAHIKNQKYCSKKECQNARRNNWLLRKLKKDQDYQDNQKTYWSKWRNEHPDYWRLYQAGCKTSKQTSANEAKNKQKQSQRVRVEITLKISPKNKQIFAGLMNKQKVDCLLSVV